MDESKRREPRLTIAETDDVAAVCENKEEGGIAIIDVGDTSEYIANVARTWAEARKKHSSSRSGP